MLKHEKDSNERLLIKTVSHLEKSGHRVVKADLDGYESPRSFTMKSADIELTPDIVTEAPNGKLAYVDVGLKTDKPGLLKTKWKLLQAVAEREKRRLMIVAHRGHFRFTDQILAEIGLSQQPIKV